MPSECTASDFSHKQMSEALVVKGVGVANNLPKQ